MPADRPADQPAYRQSETASFSVGRKRPRRRSRAASANSASPLLEAAGAGEPAGGRIRWHRICCLIDLTFISFCAANGRSPLLMASTAFLRVGSVQGPQILSGG
jgi:hypothetical protein